MQRVHTAPQATCEACFPPIVEEDPMPARTRKATAATTTRRRTTIPITEFEDFKKKIATKARELAQEHEWCGVVETALVELGVVEKKKDDDFAIADIIGEAESISEGNEDELYVKVGPDNWTQISRGSWGGMTVDSGWTWQAVSEEIENPTKVTT